MKQVIMYTHGICNRENIGGYGVTLIYNAIKKELSGRCENTTNNRMDILSVIKGLQALKESCHVTVYNNNAYLIDAMTKGWVYRWKAQQWRNSDKKPTPHVDLWEQLLELCQQHTVEFIWRQYSSKQEEYQRCDTLARSAIIQKK
uniref:RNase H family protein n=2 Tax=Candidatus Electrothrix sp. TaxID=2170559 RepID=UPI004057A265